MSLYSQNDSQIFHFTFFSIYIYIAHSKMDIQISSILFEIDSSKMFGKTNCFQCLEVLPALHFHNIWHSVCGFQEITLTTCNSFFEAGLKALMDR